MAPLSSWCLCLAAVPECWWPCPVLPILCLSLEPLLGFMALVGAGFASAQLPFWTPRCWAPRGAAPRWWLWWLNPPSGASCPFLSSLSCHQPSNLMANAVFWGSYKETGLVGAAQPAQALRRMVQRHLWAQGSCASSQCLFSCSLPTFHLVADAGAFSIRAEAQGGWRQHPVLPLLLSSCRAVKKAFQNHIS